MVKKISRKFLKGVGSVMDIYPNKSYPINSYTPGQTTVDRLRADWVKVGKTISKAINSHSNVQQ